MRLLDLFCGCGGASTGYSQAGLEIAVAVDNNEAAIASHRANHRSTEHLIMDLSNPEDLVSMFSRREFDVVHGSPPCPHFSQDNNKRDPEEGMKLIRSFEQVVQDLEPRWWIMENVRPVLKHIDGFYPKKRVLNAADYGVPQIRHRAFCGNYPDPRPTHASRPQTTLDGCQLEKWISVREALGAPCVIDTGRDWRPDGTHQVQDGEEPSPTLSTTGGQFHLVEKEDLKLWTGGGSIHSDTNRAKLRSLDEPSFAVTATVPGRLMQPVEGLLEQPARCITATRASGMIGRQLSPEECLILQGFPSDYWMFGNKTERYAQIGNAVAPPVAKAIGLAILEAGWESIL